jgi:hypothetical protein
VRGNPLGKYPKAIPSHYDIDNALCSWDDSSVYSIDGGSTWIKRTARMPTVEPGMALLCRCLASPSVQDILNDIDAGIGQ